MTIIERNKDIKPFYTSRELAGLLNVSDKSILNFHAKGYMGFPRGIKVGNQWRWKPKEIDIWIEGYRKTQEQAQARKGQVRVYKHAQESAKCTLADFAPEMYDLLTRIANACKGNGEADGINEFLHDIINSIQD